MNNQPTPMKRRVNLRDADKKLWTVTIEVRAQECTVRHRETLEKYVEHAEIAVSADGGGCSGQCRKHIRPRTDGQRQLLAFWEHYHLNGCVPGTEAQMAYLRSELYQVDYQRFVALFEAYDDAHRQTFDAVSLSMLINAYDLLDTLAEVRSFMDGNMGGNPVRYILGVRRPWYYMDMPHNREDFCVQCFFLAIRGLYVDGDYRYGSASLYLPVPEGVADTINALVNLIEEEEDALTEALNARFDMGDNEFRATQEVVDEVMQLRACDEEVAKHFIALGMYLGCTFGDLNDDFDDKEYKDRQYEVWHRSYYIGTDDELERIARWQMRNDDTYRELWAEAAKSGNTNDGLRDWIDDVLRMDGWASVLGRYDGKYEYFDVAGEEICVCRNS
jgi:hypothetical protein